LLGASLGTQSASRAKRSEWTVEERSMDDVVGAVCGLACGLVAVTLVGHGIWVLLAALFRAARGATASSPRANSASPFLASYDDLEQQLERLAAAGAIRVDTLEELRRQLAEHRARKSAAPVGDPAAAAVPDAPASSAAEQLARLLQGYPRVSPADRQRALRLHDQMDAAACGALPAHVQFDVARLLATSGRPNEALSAYRRLIEQHAAHAGAAPTALEAARLAERHCCWDDVRHFVAAARRHALTPDQARSAEELERACARREAPVVAPATTPSLIPVELIPAQPVAVPPALPASAPQPVLASSPFAAAAVRTHVASLADARPGDVRPPVAPEAPSAGAPASLSPRMPRPPRSFGRLLAAFMAQRNIRWGELAGGLLIVVSSIALVISLWEQLAQNLYWQFAALLLGTAAVFGAGLYTFHRWKLQTTSRGLLVIGTLLVPLNFLALAGSRAASPLETLICGAVSAAVLAWLVDRAGRVLAPALRPALLLGTVATSATMLLPRPAAAGDSAFWWAAVSATAAYLASCAWLLRRLVAPGVHRPAPAECFRTFGAAILPLTMAHALAALAGRDAAQAIDLLAPLVNVGAWPPLLAGLWLARPGADSAPSGSLRVTATAIALLAGGTLVVTLLLAWPNPVAILVLAAVNAVALVALGVGTGTRGPHVVAAGMLAAAYYTGYQLAAQHVAPGGPLSLLIVRDTLAESGFALAGLVLLLAALGRLVGRSAGVRQGGVYRGAAAASVAVSLAAVTLSWETLVGRDALWAGALYALYGLGLLAANLRQQRAGYAYAGLLLACAAPLWVLWWRAFHNAGPVTWPHWATVLAAEAAALAGLAAGLGWWCRRRAPDAAESGVWQRAFRTPLERMASLAAAGALLLSLAPVPRAGLDSPWFGWTYWLLAASGLSLAAAQQRAAWTYAAAIAALAALAQQFAWDGPARIVLDSLEPYTDRWPLALLLHATICTVAGMALVALRRSREVATDRVMEAPARRTALALPLAHSGAASSILALAVLLAAELGDPLALAVGLGWLAVLWLAAAVVHRWPLAFATGQLTSAAAVLAGVAAWQAQGWRWPTQSPELWQERGTALAIWCLAWTTVRLAQRGRTAFGRLLARQPGNVDRTVLGGLVLGQAVLAVVDVLPGVQAELLRPTWAAAVLTNVCVVEGWTLLGTLAVALLVPLWTGWRRAHLLAAVLLAATVPWLVADHFQSQGAAASGLRWSLGVVLLAGSAAFWCRRWLRRGARRLSCVVQLSAADRVVARTAWVLLLVAPLAALSAYVAFSTTGVKLGLLAPLAGPQSGSIFFDIRTRVTLLPPLAMLLVSLIGFAIRERSPRYALAAGLAANLIAIGSYALSVPASSFGTLALWLALVEVATAAAGLWTVAWLAVRWRLVRGHPLASGERPWIGFQVMQPVLGVTLLLGPALASLAILPVRGGWQAWPAAVGNGWGWAALLATAAAVACAIAAARRAPQPVLVALGGLAAIAWAACSIQGWVEAHAAEAPPPWGYRALELGWALYGLGIVLGVWWFDSESQRQQRGRVPDWLLRAATTWMILPGCAAVLLAIKGSLLAAVDASEFSRAWGGPQEMLWAAVTIAVVAAGGAAMAVWRRAEGWAFTAGLGVHLAASLVVWQRHLEMSFESWWALIVQANAVAASGVALLWLAARRRLRPAEAAANSPLLGLQCSLALAAALVLPALAAVLVLLDPATPHEVLRQIGRLPGWVALVAAAAAVAWHTRAERNGQLVHLLGAVLLAAAALASGASVEVADGAAPWLAYRVFVAAVAVAGVLTIGPGRYALRPRWLADDGPRGAGWATGNAALLAALAITGLLAELAVGASSRDALQPWWPCAAALAATLLSALAAVRLGSAAHVHLSGLLGCLAGSVLWFGLQRPAWTDATLLAEAAELLAVNAGCCGAAALLWTLAGAVSPRLSVARVTRFPQSAVTIAVVLLSVVGILGIVGNHVPAGPATLALSLVWPAWGVVAAAIAATLWFGRRRRAALPQAYAAGLAAIALGLDRLGPSAARLAEWSALALAGYLLLASGAALAVGRLVPQRAVPRGNRRNPPNLRIWFTAAQIALALLVAGLATWLAIDPLRHAVAFRVLAAPATIAGALAVALVGQRGTSAWRTVAQTLCLTLAALALAQAGWAGLPAGLDPFWLQRAGTLVAAVLLALVAVAWWLAPRLPQQSSWRRGVTNGAAILAAASAVAVAAMLQQEWVTFEWSKGNPLWKPVVAAVAVAMAATIAALLHTAIRPRLDLLRLTDTGRQAYVYAAEALGGVLWLHLYLCVPRLLRITIMKQWWLFIAMAIAFAGTGLAELFRRRRLPVLAQPLQRTAACLPLVPVIGYWAAVLWNTEWSKDVETPYWSLLMLVGLFYGLLAVRQRSRLFAAASVVAANSGLWALLNEQGIDFVKYPHVWLIPPALATLAAEYWHHDRLSRAQSTTIRYLATAVIYVSATSDMFIDGLQRSMPWGPLTLLGLSLLGMLAGMMFRVRSFLALGVTFLVVTLATMLYYAGFMHEQYWVLYAAGIVAGALLLALFGLVEKRKQDVLGAIDRLKHWEA
jgi:hypothetical protein